MLGNVWEWVADWYESNYPDGAVADPTGPARGQYRIVRGGDWGTDPWRTSIPFRSSLEFAHDYSVGVRCASN